jgi:hypothetical protein
MKEHDPTSTQKHKDYDQSDIEHLVRVRDRSGYDDVIRWCVPSFVIVGTPRSGTTLVQRLASEIDGVGMPPETHFLSRFAQPLLARRRMPLDTATVREELDAYLALPTSRGFRLDPDDVLSRLGTGRHRLIDVFGAVVAGLAGPAHRYGEKTPEHLRWLGPLSRALPQLRVVVVVRDPRAVAASHRAVAWGVNPPQLLAEQWCIDLALLGRARRELGGRLITLRYEDVVADPDRARAQLAAFLRGTTGPDEEHARNGRRRAGTDDARSGTDDARCGTGQAIVLEWESWKHRALGPVTGERIAAWRETLGSDVADDVVARCRAGMAALGYRDLPSPAEARSRVLSWPCSLQQQCRSFRGMKAASQTAIDRVSLV